MTAACTQSHMYWYMNVACTQSLVLVHNMTAACTHSHMLVHNMTAACTQSHILVYDYSMKTYAYMITELHAVCK